MTLPYTNYWRVHHRTTNRNYTFLPRQMWLVLPLHFRLKCTPNILAMRGLMEPVGRLSACADFSLRDFYHGFWKPELFGKTIEGLGARPSTTTWSS